MRSLDEDLIIHEIKDLCNRFSIAQKITLIQAQEKKGYGLTYKKMTLLELLTRLLEEITEMAESMSKGDGDGMVEESLHVGNIAMMIWDNVGRGVILHGEASRS